MIEWNESIEKQNPSQNSQRRVHPDLFPRTYQESQLVEYCKVGQKVVQELLAEDESGRVPGGLSRDAYTSLVDKYSNLPEKPLAPLETLQTIARDFLPGALHWRNRNAMHNVGAAVNIVAAAIQSIALDLNINLVNDDVAGNTILAERAVANMLARLANLNPLHTYGNFSFGGTGTILYALKIGTRKAWPDSGRTGIPPETVVFITPDAHFSHMVAADWIGIGSANVIDMAAREDRTTNVAAAEQQIRTQITHGKRIGAIIINGGTTYDHTIDDIAAFAQMRNRLVTDYALPYIPHLHVDAVIGWSWLNFGSYDFTVNELTLPNNILDKLRGQYERIRHIRLADSWGVDFHKGVGSCPVDCSMIMLNNQQDWLLLSKKGNADNLHQISNELANLSPVDYTLETSRSGAKVLAALTALRTIGQRGYQILLANLVESVATFQQELQKTPDIDVVNSHSLGHVAMVRMYPPELATTPARVQELIASRHEIREFSEYVNKYNQAFFKWDAITRMCRPNEVLYSLSKNYIHTPSGCDITTLKFYPVSPHVDPGQMMEVAKLLIQQKVYFDQNIWHKVEG